jgi:hypothetical protein
MRNEVPRLQIPPRLDRCYSTRSDMMLEIGYMRASVTTQQRSNSAAIS